MNFIFPTGQHNKVHSSYIWLSPLIGVGAAFIVFLLSNIDIAFQGASAFSGTGLPIVLLFLAILVILAVLYGIIVGITALAYRHLSFVFDEAEFSLYSGIFIKRRVHVPYARVQSVNHRQSLIQRFAGVCTVEIDTAGGAANKAVKVPYVKLDVGEAIRADLFMRKAQILAGASSPAQLAQALPADLAGGAIPAPAGFAAGGGTGAPAGNVLDEVAAGLGVNDFRGIYGGAMVGMEPVSYERKLANSELVFASLSHSSFGGLLASFVTMLVLLLVFMLSFASLAREILVATAFSVPFIFAAMLFSVVVAFLVTVLSFGNFSVRRRGSRIEVERGILQRDFSGIDIDRIQSVVVRQSFVRRLLGYCEVSLGRISAGGEDDQGTQAKLNTGALVVHPFLKLDQVDTLLAGLLPEFSDRPVSSDFKGLPPVALRRGILRRCFWQNGFAWTALMVALLQIAFNMTVSRGVIAVPAQVVFGMNASCAALYALLLVALAFAVLGTVWWKRGSGFALNRGYAALCNEGLSTETVYLPRQKIQDVTTRTNPFQRMAHTTTIAALTAAGVGGTNLSLWDVSEEDGAAWLDWLKPRRG